jgi:hypothetical protein
MTDIAKIAAGLTKAEQDMVQTKRGDHATLISPAIDRLWYSVTKNSPDDFSIALTPLGQQVRDYLKENNHVER